MAQSNTPALNGTTIKAVIVGPEGAGKSSLMRAMQQVANTEEGLSPEELGYQSGVMRDDQFRMVEMANVGSQANESCRVQVWDTPPQPPNSMFSSDYKRGARLVFVTFDVNDRDSFEQTKEYLAYCTQRTTESEPVAIVLLGNKNDTPSRKMVSTDEAQRLADTYGIRFFEVSSLKEQQNHSLHKALRAGIEEVQNMQWLHQVGKDAKAAIPIIEIQKPSWTEWIRKVLAHAKPYLGDKTYQKLEGIADRLEKRYTAAREYKSNQKKEQQQLSQDEPTNDATASHTSRKTRP